MANGLGMGMRDSGEGDEGSAVMGGRGSASVGSGKVTEKVYRFPRIIRELWEDFAYSFLFFLEFFLLILE